MLTTHLGGNAPVIISPCRDLIRTLLSIEKSKIAFFFKRRWECLVNERRGGAHVVEEGRMAALGNRLIEPKRFGVCGIPSIAWNSTTYLARGLIRTPLLQRKDVSLQLPEPKLDGISILPTNSTRGLPQSCNNQCQSKYKSKGWHLIWCCGLWVVGQIPSHTGNPISVPMPEHSHVAHRVQHKEGRYKRVVVRGVFFLLGRAARLNTSSPQPGEVGESEGSHRLG